MKPGFYVEAFRSFTLCRVYNVREHRNKPMIWGPFKREKFAKKRATALRKDRCVAGFPPEFEMVDHGPSFVRVRVFEVTAATGAGGRHTMTVAETHADELKTLAALGRLPGLALPGGQR